MLSPRLLDILRAYWRRARPGLRPFPGREAGDHVSIAALQEPCRVARRTMMLLDLKGIGAEYAPAALVRRLDLLAGARRHRCDEPDRAAQFQRDENGGKIGLDSVSG